MNVQLVSIKSESSSQYLTLWLGVESSDQNSRKAIKPKICHLASSETASQRAGGLPLASGKGVPSICIAHGNLIPLACTMYPTNANIAIRPCLEQSGYNIVRTYDTCIIRVKDK